MNQAQDQPVDPVSAPAHAPNATIDLTAQATVATLTNTEARAAPDVLFSGAHFQDDSGWDEFNRRSEAIPAVPNPYSWVPEPEPEPEPEPSAVRPPLESNPEDEEIPSGWFDPVLYSQSIAATYRAIADTPVTNDPELTQALIAAYAVQEVSVLRNGAPPDHPAFEARKHRLCAQAQQAAAAQVANIQDRVARGLPPFIKITLDRRDTLSPVQNASFDNEILQASKLATLQAEAQIAAHRAQIASVEAPAVAPDDPVQSVNGAGEGRSTLPQLYTEPISASDSLLALDPRTSPQPATSTACTSNLDKS
ncbi:hypothetical protein BJ170DRAFT_684728 [Xylariales sp. AK1849]|nr:hypothetical protein BJ170DRAFT_684728 [Xylariales sp. AK1849]